MTSSRHLVMAHSSHIVRVQSKEVFKISTILSALSHASLLIQVVAVPMPLQEDPEVTLGALRWTMDHLYRAGDVIHIVHVIKCLVHKLEVFHGESALLSAPPGVSQAGHLAQ